MKRYINRVTWIGLILVYLVVLAGSVVRMTGSGMGCPDWPKCFGQWIPPTDESELPEDYKEHYSEKRAIKIEDFAQQLETIGFKNQAQLIRNDESLLDEEDFNTFKTWTEYVNRLVGFLAGNFFLLAFILSIFYVRKRKSLLVLSFINLVIIGFQAWFGSIVVATNLLPWTITIHMFLALLIIAIHLELIRRSSEKPSKIKINNKFLQSLFILALLLTVVQIFLGTQVRQEVDTMLSAGASRSDIPENFDLTFYIHRTLSLLVLGLHAFIFYRLRKQFNTTLKLILLIIVVEILLGVIMYYISMPAWTQPLHLVLATAMFGLQIHWLLSQIPQHKKQETTHEN